MLSDLSASADTMSIIIHTRMMEEAESQPMVIMSSISAFLDTISMFHNLHTLTMDESVENGPVLLPPEIWEMSLLRHLDIKNVILPDPPTVIDRERCVLGNLQKLGDVNSLKLSEEVLKRIPNLKKLKMTYTQAPDTTLGWKHYCLNNLADRKSTRLNSSHAQ